MKYNEIKYQYNEIKSKALIYFAKKILPNYE